MKTIKVLGIELSAKDVMVLRYALHDHKNCTAHNDPMHWPFGLSEGGMTRHGVERGFLVHNPSTAHHDDPQHAENDFYMLTPLGLQLAMVVDMLPEENDPPMDKEAVWR